MGRPNLEAHESKIEKKRKSKPRQLGGSRGKIGRCGSPKPKSPASKWRRTWGSGSKRILHDNAGKIEGKLVQQLEGPGIG